MIGFFGENSRARKVIGQDLVMREHFRQYGPANQK